MTFQNLRKLESVLTFFDIIPLVIIVVGLPIAAACAPFIVAVEAQSDFFIVAGLFEIICIILLIHGLRRLSAIRKNQEVWRAEFGFNEWPTINSVAIQAKDEIKLDGIYSLVIYHVIALPGCAGFMSSIQKNGENIQTGDVYRGTDRKTYNRAKRQGLLDFKKTLKERQRQAG